MEVLTAFMASYLGFLTFNLTHSERGKIGKKLPEIKYKRVQISPSIKLQLFGRTIWIHHWVSFTVIILVSLFISNTFLDSFYTRSFLAGGILQGLSLPDYRQIIIKSR